MRFDPRIIFPFLFLLCPFLLFSQTEGELCLNIVPKNSFVKIDTTLIDLSEHPSPHCIKLPTGFHEVKIWASGFSVRTEKVEVKSGETTNLNLGLKDVAPDYRAYLSELEKYNKTRLRRSLEMGFMLVVDVGATVFAVNALSGNNFKDYKKSAIDARKIYESTINPGEIEMALETYQTASKAYEEERSKYLRRLAIYGPPALVSYGATYWLIRKHRRKRPAKPVFEELNPLVNVSFNTPEGIGASCEFGLTLKF